MNLIQTADDLVEGTKYLGQVDRNLAVLIEQDGVPPLWNRDPGFPTLVHIILEQQVSLASAQAAFDRLIDALPELVPKAFLTLSDDELRSIGFSRQKTRYVRLLAESLENGTLSLSTLINLPDQDATDQLTRVKGIGQWTADIYLLMALGRTDVWPVGDLALVKSVQNVKKMSKRPSAEEMFAVAEHWRPWRSVAARILWNHYLIRLTGRSGMNS